MVKEGAIPMEYLCDSNAYGKNTDRMKSPACGCDETMHENGARGKNYSQRDCGGVWHNKADLLSKFQGQI